MTAIEVGQEWRRRRDGRVVSVLELDGDPAFNGFVVIKPLVGGRRSSIRADGLRSRFDLCPPSPSLERNTQQ